MKRRDFMKAAAASVAGVPATAAPEADQLPDQPLKAEVKVQTLVLEPRTDGKVLIKTDGPDVPQPLIRKEVLDRAFGKGMAVELRQTDHWRMIEEAWFSGDELYVPYDFEDEQYRIWMANYRPECEAHDILFDLFKDRLEGFMGSFKIAELGLEFGEHPATPRYATVKLKDYGFYELLAEELAASTRWVRIAPEA